MRKRINPNLCKIHRCYTVEEAAELLGVHKHTIRNWIKNGLPVYDDKKPLLILGSDLKLFIKESLKKNKQPCQLAEIYCFKCRAPRKVQLNTAKFIQHSTTIGRVFGKCCECGSKGHKYFSWRNLESLGRALGEESTVSTKTHKYEK